MRALFQVLLALQSNISKSSRICSVPVKITENNTQRKPVTPTRTTSNSPPTQSVDVLVYTINGAWPGCCFVMFADDVHFVEKSSILTIRLDLSCKLRQYSEKSYFHSSPGIPFLFCFAAPVNFSPDKFTKQVICFCVSIAFVFLLERAFKRFR